MQKLAFDLVLKDEKDRVEGTAGGGISINKGQELGIRVWNKGKGQAKDDLKFLFWVSARW